MDSQNQEIHVETVTRNFSRTSGPAQQPVSQPRCGNCNTSLQQPFLVRFDATIQTTGNISFFTTIELDPYAPLTLPQVQHRLEETAHNICAYTSSHEYYQKVLEGYVVGRIRVRWNVCGDLKEKLGAWEEVTDEEGFGRVLRLMAKLGRGEFLVVVMVEGEKESQGDGGRDVE